MNSCRNPQAVPYGRGECRMPEMTREKENCRMPDMAREKEDCYMYGNGEWPIGMTYVPMQEWKKIYQPDEGFHKGTIFAELDLPFLGRRMC